MLTLGSVVFYAIWNPLLLPLLITSILVNFMIDTVLARPSASQRKTILLSAGIAANVIRLGIFKYAGFFADTVSTVSGIEEFEILRIRKGS